ncbi:MAG: ribosome silencing factor [Phycisphaerae bacterium]|nr:ribosome silencing factor [Phycisphaerae bacterium]
MARLCADDKCEDVRIRDVRGLSQICDYLIVASGTSDRQMKAVAQHLEDLGKARGSAPFQSNRDEATTWVVVDFVEIVVHLFEPAQREYYDLEGLWADGKIVEWKRTAAPARASG